jgi:PPOX class probable F420-dependent enzyme
MPTPPLPADLAEILGRPNPAVIATVRPDGQPVSVATWYLYENDGVLVNMDAGRRRLDYLRADPRVSLTVLGEDWYNHISIQGEVAEISDDLDLSGIDRISKHYTGQAYPNRERPRVNAWIRIDRWHGWGEFSRSAS